MPQTQLVPARRPIYPVDVAWPAGSIEGAGAVPGASIPDRNRVQIMSGQQVPGLAVTAGSSGGGGVNTFYGLRSVLMANLFSTGARAVEFFQHPALGIGQWVEPFRSAGAVMPDYAVVQWLRVWHTLEGPPVYTGDGTGVGMAAFEGAGLTEADLPGGLNPNKLMCGLLGRDEGGAQAYRWRSYDPAGAVIETVDVPFGPAINEARGLSVNCFDFVVRASRKPEAGGAIDATFSLHANDPTGLSPVLTRDIARNPIGTQIPAPVEYTPTAGAAGPWGWVWCVSDLDPATASPQRYRWRLRGGRYLPDGSELPLD